MPSNVAACEALVQAAAGSGHCRNTHNTDELKERLRARLDRNGDNRSVSEDGSRFSLDLSDIHLNGLGEEVPCLLLAGAEQVSVSKISDWRSGGVFDSSLSP